MSTIARGDGSLDLTELRRRVAQEVEQERADRGARLGPHEEALFKLVLVPSWTLELASRLGLMPHLETLEQEGLLDVHGGHGESELSLLTAAKTGDQVEFRLKPAERERQIARLISTGRNLQPLAQQLGSELAALSASDTHVPESTRRWAALAVGGPDALASNVERLLGEARGLLVGTREGTGADASIVRAEEFVAEAMNLVLTARYLDVAFGSSWVSDVAAASRRVDFFGLWMADERRLANYVVRKDQEEAFHQLASSPDSDPVWALHFVGKAGVGKTMLARHLCTRVIPARGEFWARIDFDHLNPAYPSQQPWLLLDQLGDQLRLQDPSGVVNKELYYFDRMRLSVRELSADLSSWEAIQSHGLWQELVGAFGRALGAFQRRVYLVFDTCEELARITTGFVPPNVAATFSILTRLHEIFPPLRVVFMGRRPLASMGSGWTQRHPDPWLSPLAFLRLHEARSFTHEEATEAFQRIAGARASQPLIEAALQRCVEPPAPSVYKVYEQPVQPGEVRYAPFDVASYAQWLRHDASLTPEVLSRADTDRYVEVRIIERLRDPEMERLLPAVALLGRFDERLLAAAARVSEDEAFTRAFQQLVRQEWVSRDGRYHQVDSTLRRRLEGYYRRKRPADLNAVSEAATGWLRRETLDGSVTQLPRFLYVTLAWLTREEPDSLEWWRKVEQHAVDQGAHEQLAEVCAELLAAEGPLPASKRAAWEALRAEVLTTNVGAYLALGKPADSVVSGALEVVDSPKADTHAVLRCRLALLAADPFPPIPAQTRLSHTSIWDQLAEEVGRDRKRAVHAFVNAVEAVLERAEEKKDFDLLLQVGSLFYGLADAHDSVLSMVFLRMLAGRIAMLKGSGRDAVTFFRRALEWAPIQRSPTRGWSDWRAPEDAGARIRLEAIRALHGRHFQAAELVAFMRPYMKDWKMDPTCIDHDRLFSAWLGLRCAIVPPSYILPGPMDAGILDTAAIAEHSPQVGAPTCAAHRAFAPAYVTLAAALAEAGRESDASSILSRGLVVAQGAARTVVGASESDAARWRIARLYRRQQEWSGVYEPSVLARMPEVSDESTEMWSILGLRQGLPRELSQLHAPLFDTPEDQPAQAIHVCWRALSLHTQEDARWAARWLERGCKRSSLGNDEWTAALALDLQEANELVGRFGLEPIAGHPFVPPISPWTPPERKLRLQLRADALGVRFVLELVPLIQQVGHRRAAQIALDEGELLARRLPLRAERLLLQASRLFADSGDPRNAWVAAVFRGVAAAEDEDHLQEAVVDLEALEKSSEVSVPELSLHRAYLNLLTRRPRNSSQQATLDETVASAQTSSLPVDLVSLRTQFLSRQQQQQQLARPSRPIAWAIKILRFTWGLLSPLRLVRWIPSLRRMVLGPTFSVAWEGNVFEGGRGVTAGIFASGRAERVTASLEAPYEKSGAQVSITLKASNALSRKSGPIEFRLDAAAATLCWESAIGFGLSDRLEKHLSLDIRRSTALNFAPPALKPVPLERFSVVDYLEIERLETSLSPTASDDSSSRALHAMGTVTLTSRGVRLQLSGSDDLPGSERSELFDAKTLLEKFKGLRACVIQAPPPSIQAERTGSDRLDAAYARQFAAELAASGQLTVVLCIPPLSRELAKEINGPLNDALRSNVWSEALPETVTRIRILIFNALQRTSSAYELAMDVCLYMPPRSALLLDKLPQGPTGKRS